MVYSETFLDLGFTNLAVPAWTVILFVVLATIFVLMRRIQVYLLTTHLFSLYWGFILYWAVFLSEGTTSTTTFAAFTVYTFCGLALASLAIIGFFRANSPRPAPSLTD